MNIQTTSIFLTLLVCYTLQLNGNEELEYPPGTIDLVPDHRFEQFKDPKFDTVALKVKVEDIVYDEVGTEGLNEYRIDYVLPSWNSVLRMRN